MSWLEYLGLQSLFSSDIVASGGGILFILAVIAWVLLLIFKPELVNQGIVTFNLLGVVFLLFFTIWAIIDYFIRKKKQNKSIVVNIIFAIILPIILVIAFMYGMNNPYHAMIFKYEYTKICSGVATMIYPLIIYNILLPIFCCPEKFSVNVTLSFSALMSAVMGIIVGVVISQFVSFGLFVARNETFYNNFATYHNFTIAKHRKNWEFSSIEDCIKKTLPIDAKKFVESYKEKNQNLDKLFYDIHYKSPHFPNETLSKYDLEYKQAKFESDHIAVYYINDKEYGTNYFVKFDYSNYSVVEFVDNEYYDNIKLYVDILKENQN